MIIEVISTGTELMRGNSIDTNFSYTARSILSLGIEVKYHSTCGDELSDIIESIKTACRRANIVILTGGLGPTADDLTRNAAAEAFDVPLIFNKKEWLRLKERIRRYRKNYGKIKIIDSLKRQAFFPQSTSIIGNSVGAAAGFYMKRNNAYFFALPGVPKEMEVMLNKTVIPIIKTLIRNSPLTADHLPLIEWYRIFGIPEAIVEDMIKPFFIRNTQYSYGLTVKNETVTISVKVRGDGNISAKTLISRANNYIRKTFGYNLLGDGSSTLAGVTANILMDKRITLSIAESCTGGLIAHKLTNVHGISKSLVEAIVCYSNESKIARLGVPHRLISKYGAVSKEVAVAMAKGVAQLSGSDIGLAATGIAGPTGSSKKKPIGLVYMCLWDNRRNREFSQKFIFSGGREHIKERSANRAINILRMYLIKGKI
ncbi:MAG: hypothetical protein A2W23_09045 [Planctomycetes bacterium RBG_16_43_13]|nr:MAG: hypothetical protein A2W23_09045 [Planctomycetes bacterium RBG_16_43_13]